MAVWPGERGFMASVKFVSDPRELRVFRISAYIWSFINVCLTKQERKITIIVKILEFFQFKSANSKIRSLWAHVSKDLERGLQKNGKIKNSILI